MGNAHKPLSESSQPFVIVNYGPVFGFAMPNNAVKRFCGREHLRQIWDWLARTIEDASHPEPGVVTLFTEHYEKFYELL